MTLLRILTRPLISLTLLGAIGIAMADESKFSGEFLNLETAADQHSSQRVLEFWGYHNTTGDQVQNDILKLRYYQPLTFDQWRGTMRLDTSYVSTYGPTLPAQSSGTYNAGNTMLTIWGNHPDVLKNWGGTLGGRIIFPFGNSGQWAVGPQVGTVYVQNRGINPSLRLFTTTEIYVRICEQGQLFDQHPESTTPGSKSQYFPDTRI